MKRILVVEDEAVLRALLVEEIEDFGYACTQAANGQEALQCVAREMPDLIVSDGVMPALDGPGFIRRFRAEYGAKSAPIVLISALEATADIERALAAGADIYIRKPIDFEELSDAIKRLLSDAGRRTETRA